MKAANDVCRSPLTGARTMQNANDRSTSIADSARRAVPRRVSQDLVINESLYSPCIRDELDQPIGAAKIVIAPILV